MQTGYQNQRKNGRQQVLTALMVACSLGASTAESPFAEMSDSTVLQATTMRTIVEKHTNCRHRLYSSMKRARCISPGLKRAVTYRRSRRCESLTAEKLSENLSG